MRPFKAVIFFVLLSLLPLTSVSADSLRYCDGAVLISREIKPYIHMVQALEENLDVPLCRVFLDNKGQVYSLDTGFSGLNSPHWQFFVAVGPTALNHLVKDRTGVPVFYGMVLNPGRIIKDSPKACGVSLNLFDPDKIRSFQKILPGLKRLAVIYNPDSNQVYQTVLKDMAQVSSVSAVPLEVFSESDIRSALRRTVDRADAIYFIPDRTVSVPAIIKFIIKYGIAHSVPSLGYNRFFYESGAVLSLDVDYRATGRKVAQTIKEFREKGVCGSSGPETRWLFNEKVAKRLKMEVNGKFSEQ